MNPTTPRPIDPDDIRIGDRVQRRFEYDGGDIGTHEGTVKDVGSTYIRLQTRAVPKRIENATWTLLDRPAPPMEPLPTEPGTVIWVDAIEGVALDKPVKAMLTEDVEWCLTHWQDARCFFDPSEITTWHPAEPERRTVSTAEELDALLTGAVIRSAGGTVAKKERDGWRTTSGLFAGHAESVLKMFFEAPFTVLWEGD